MSYYHDGNVIRNVARRDFLCVGGHRCCAEASLTFRRMLESLWSRENKFVPTKRSLRKCLRRDGFQKASLVGVLTPSLVIVSRTLHEEAHSIHSSSEKPAQ